MIIEIKEYGKFLLMTGIKDFEVSNYDEINEKLTEHDWQVDLQLLDAQKNLDSHHIYFATLSALNAFKRKKKYFKKFSIRDSSLCFWTKTNQGRY